MVTSLLLGRLPMQDFCGICGRDGLTTADTPVRCLSRIACTPEEDRAAIHAATRKAEPLAFTGLPRRARLKRAA